MKKEKGSVLPGAMDNDNQILHSVMAPYFKCLHCLVLIIEHVKRVVHITRELEM